MFHFILYVAKSSLHFVFVVWVCTRDSSFLHSTFNFDLCNIQVSRSRHSTFHKQQSSFRIRTSSSVKCTFIFLHPTFSICPLRFRFPHPTLGTVLASFRIRHSTFRIELLPAGQRAMEIVGSIDLTHLRSNSGRESVERLPSGVDSGDLLHSRQLDVDRRVHDRVIKAADRQDAAAPAN